MNRDGTTRILFAILLIAVLGSAFLVIAPFLPGFTWAAVLVVCLVGFVLTAVRAKTKSVASSFLAHVGYNTTLMVLAALQTDGFRHMEKAAALLF